MDHDVFQACLEEAVKLTSTPAFNIESFCFPEQVNFIRDPARNKTAVCSRRAGKTVACAADLIETALEFDNCVTLYITLKRANAKKLIWPELLKINRTFNLGGVTNVQDLSLTFPNGSVVYCSGAKDASEIENFRGLAIKKVYVDEAQAFRAYIEELIDDVLSKALFDYNGILCLTGTPGPIEAGYYYKACKSTKWSNHVWTMHQNPWLEKKSGRKISDLIQEDMDRMGVTIDHPKIQRECFGRWVTDTESLVLHYNEAVNHYETLPLLNWTYILGIDLGFHDSDALAVLAWCEASPATYLVEEVITSKQGITPLVEQIEVLRKKYDISKMVIDTGGLGKKIAEELIRRHQLPVEAADKVRKMENLELLDDALRRGAIKAKKDSMFAQDSFLMEKDRDKSNPERIVISDSYHSDIIDAVLYSFKLSPAYSYQAPKVKPKLGTPEWAKEQTDEMEEAAERHFQSQEDAAQGFGFTEWPEQL